MSWTSPCLTEQLFFNPLMEKLFQKPTEPRFFIRRVREDQIENVFPQFPLEF